MADFGEAIWVCAFFIGSLLNGRRGLVTFDAPKVTKSACHRQGFFAAQAFALQNRQNHGL
jgi:uncharacterized protein YcgL (UPF0745 family)